MTQLSPVLLGVLVLLPVAAALFLAVARPSRSQAASTATGTAGLTTLAAVAVFADDRPWTRQGTGAELDLPWVGLLGSRFHLAMDGISGPLVLLTTVLTLLCCLYVTRSGDNGEAADVARPGAHPVLLACLLLVEAGAVGTFLARDLVLFFVAFETVLVPMWFLIDRWGDERRRRGVPDPEAARSSAAARFVMYTVTGSAVMLLGLVLLALRGGSTDLDVLATTGPALDLGSQSAIAVLLLVGLGVKVPVWPLHSWLPPAHSIAPTVGSVLLAGVLLKLGTYGLVRLVQGLVPDGLERWAPGLAVLGVVGIVWGSLVCLAERDLKRLIAFSSVAHMGFVVVGVASGTPQGVQGALFASVAHGVITGLLFLVVGMIKYRWHTADLVELGSGLRDRAPRLGWVLALGAVAGVGLPGLAGFWGEVLAILGAWEGEAWLGPVGSRWVAVIAAVGTALAAAYLLRVLFLLWHGPVVSVPADVDEPVRDLGAVERLVAAPLVLATIVLGILPWLLLSVTGPAVRLLLGGAS